MPLFSFSSIFLAIPSFMASLLRHLFFLSVLCLLIISSAASNHLPQVILCITYTSQNTISDPFLCFHKRYDLCSLSLDSIMWFIWGVHQVEMEEKLLRLQRQIICSCCPPLYQGYHTSHHHNNPSLYSHGFKGLILGI